MNVLVDTNVIIDWLLVRPKNGKKRGRLCFFPFIDRFILLHTKIIFKI